jgi:hypothetical protein
MQDGLNPSYTPIRPICLIRLIDSSHGSRKSTEPAYLGPHEREH